MKKYLSLIAVMVGVFIGFNAYVIAAEANIKLKVLKEGQPTNDAHGYVTLTNNGNVQSQDFTVNSASEPVNLHFFNLQVGTVTVNALSWNSQNNCFGQSDSQFRIRSGSDTIRQRIMIDMNCN